MMEARLLRAGKERELFETIESNLDIYRAGDFSYLESDPSVYICTDIDINLGNLSEVQCTEDDHNEVQNCIEIFQALGAVTHYLARDSRLWVYLTHTHLLDYSRTRWPIPEDTEKAVHHIKNHFFVVGARGFERDNAASRLWWMASLCSRVDGLSLEQALTALLYQYDVRANIIERPTTSQTIHVFSAVIKKLYESYEDDKSLFERQKFRDLMKKMNLRGGVSLMSAMDETSVSHILNDCVEGL